MDNKINHHLPLMSNTNEILVNHYIFYFICNFDDKKFTSTAILFLEPVHKNGQFNCNNSQCTSKKKVKIIDELRTAERHTRSQIFTLILDCNNIFVTQIEALDLTETEINMLKFSNSKPVLKYIVPMDFMLEEWCLKIWKDGACCQFCFPRIIRIKYTTAPDGSSLLWVPDQDKRPSVFTYGAWSNNRSLFPCQEPPTAMATWEATVSVHEPAIVLMSGDVDAIVSRNFGMTHYYYFTKKVLPMSTFALAVGFWEIYNLTIPEWKSPTCRIISPPSLLSKSVKILSSYFLKSVVIAEYFLGPYPFPRIDLLVVPRAFGSLGMASPNLIYVSQSVLCEDGSMCSRIAHEIAHSWFGLLIGASDWTEEWLSEGFATYMEDYIHIKVLNLPESVGKDFCDMKSYLRMLILKAEVENTNDQLQVLRINKGETIKATVDNVEAVMVKDGKNPMNSFIQIHYIKGYFLLKHLSDLVGFDSFMSLLRCYVEKFKGQLVDSQAVIQMYFEKYPDIIHSMNWTIEDFFEKWLHSPGVPTELQELNPATTNKLFSSAMNQAKILKASNADLLKKRGKKRKFTLCDFSDTLVLKVEPEQKILVLESLLEEKKVASSVLKFLLHQYCTIEENPEVKHRMCELIAKHKYKPGYTFLENFLKNDLAMGVYLFGEMIFSGDRLLDKLARKCYFDLKSEMEPNFINTIETMLQNS